MSGGVLCYDIEVSPNIALCWSAGYKLTIPPENIVKERAIICIAWMTVGQKKVHSLTWDENQCDKAMIGEFVSEHLNKARVICGHNADKFDLRWIRGRAIKHGIPMQPHYVSVDTLKQAKRLAYFNSNKLDYLGDFLGYGRKRKVGFDLWRRVLIDNDEDSLRQMVRYCRRDVVLLRDVYLRLQPFASAPDSIARDIFACPNCASERTTIQKRRRTAAGHDKVQFQCKDCGQYHTVAAKRYEKAIEGNG